MLTLLERNDAKCHRCRGCGAWIFGNGDACRDCAGGAA